MKSDDTKSGWKATPLRAKYAVDFHTAANYFFTQDHDAGYVADLWDARNVTNRIVEPWKRREPYAKTTLDTDHAHAQPLTRTTRYTFPIEGYPIGPSSSDGVEKQTLLRPSKTAIVCVVESATPNVPFGRNYTAKAVYTIESVGRGITSVQIDVEVIISGAPLGTQFIRWATKNGLGDYYRRAEQVINAKLGAPIREAGAVVSVAAETDQGDGVAAQVRASPASPGPGRAALAHLAWFICLASLGYQVWLLREEVALLRLELRRQWF